MAKIHVDGRELEVDPTQNLLHVCLSNGLDVPYFCWHPALGSVGACRQCAVKQYRDAEDGSGRIVIACMTAATEGTRISIIDPEAVQFRAGVIEWLMANHPHDCPVCEEGGECHLQDMTLLSGHTQRRYRFSKRTHRNQDLGPFLKHEMNRCIACYRCVRFYRDYAGGRDLDVQASRDRVYFGRHADGALENEFSGNLAEVCPTGVFTDKTFSARYTRKWDLLSAPSVCVHCGLGCNTFLNARQGELRRVLNRYHAEVNRYFLCDRGRFGHGFVQGSTRVRTALRARGDATAAPLPASMALEQLADWCRVGDVIGIGSPRASLEANFALRTLVGPERFHLGVADLDAQLLASVLELQRAFPVASLREAEACDAVLVLGEDVCESAPRLALTLRQAARHAAFELAERQKIPSWQDAAVRDLGRDLRSPLMIATSHCTRLDDVASHTFTAAPDDIARLGMAIAAVIDPAAPGLPDLPPELQQLAASMAAALTRAARPLLVAGTSLRSGAILQATANIALALRRTRAGCRILLTTPECNSLGTALLGGEPLSAALEALRTGRASSAIVLENDLYRRTDSASIDAALAAASHVVVLDHTLTETMRHAHLVLPAATFAEADGTCINNEGRAQRCFPVLFPQDEVRESWRWLNQAAVAAGEPEQWHTIDQLHAALAQVLPQLASIRQAAPPASYRVAGSAVRNAPHRYSGRTAQYANRTLQEPRPPMNPDAPYSNSMEGYYGTMPAALYPLFWAPGWNAHQAALNKFQQEVGGPLRGGEAGVRLLEPAVTAAADYSTQVPEAFIARPDQWLIVPRHHVFGSEEASARAPAIQERIGPALLTLNAEDARTLGLGSGAVVDVMVGAATQRCTLLVERGVPRGLGTLGSGLPDTPNLGLPAWAKLRGAAESPA